MNSAQIKCLATFSIFAVIGFGPVSPGCLIGMYIVILRPAWFLQLVMNMYGTTEENSVAEPNSYIRLKCFLSLLTLFIIDILPVPVTPVIAFFIILSKPRWFYRLVSRVYQASKILSRNKNTSNDYD